MDVLVKNIRNRERARRCYCAANMADPKGRHDFTFCAYCQSERLKFKAAIVTSKVCPKCPEKGEQPREAFVVRKRNGMQALQSWCRECAGKYRKAYGKAYYAAKRLKREEQKAAAKAKRQAEIDNLAYVQTDSYQCSFTVKPPRYCKLTGRVLDPRS